MQNAMRYVNTERQNKSLSHNHRSTECVVQLCLSPRRSWIKRILAICSVLNTAVEFLWQCTSSSTAFVFTVHEVFRTCWIPSVLWNKWDKANALGDNWKIWNVGYEVKLLPTTELWVSFRSYVAVARIWWDIFLMFVTDFSVARFAF